MHIILAIIAAAAVSPEARTIHLPPGTTRLDAPIVISAEDGACTIEGAEDGSSVLSGAKLLEGLEFVRGEDGVWSADCILDEAPDQLFVDGKRYSMARFPNRRCDRDANVFDVWRLGDGSSGDDDALAPERVRRWRDPRGAYVHAMQELLWGDMHWRVTGVAGDGTLSLEGGWQNNRPTARHPVYRYVENVREELDAPGEWFYDAVAGKLYAIPLEGTDLRRAEIETVVLRKLLEIAGEPGGKPAAGVRVRNVTFRHAARTFMDTRERILRSDWALYRGAAVEIRNARGCVFENCRFESLGGNAMIFDGRCADCRVEGCAFTETGASGILFLGACDAVRVPIFDYAQTAEMATVDRTPGPANDNYPRDCTVDDCLFYRTGREEKQSAGISIDIAARITVRNCTIAFVPRAGINIGDGAFGGHLIEGCDVFDTVLETGDHGAFNSWGRDRWWSASLEFDDATMDERPELLRADMLERNKLRANRWRCNYGWDIDLDDGSSFYTIEDNVCLAGGIKLREGFGRVVRGNWCLNNGLHPHCWLKDSGDVVTNNVFFAPFAPVWHGPWRGLLTAPNKYVMPGEEESYPQPEREFGVRSARMRKLRHSLFSGPEIPEARSRVGGPVAEEPERREAGGMTWRRFNGPLEYSAYGVRADFEGWVLESGAVEPFKDGDLVQGALPPDGSRFPVSAIRNQTGVELGR